MSALTAGTLSIQAQTPAPAPAPAAPPAPVAMSMPAMSSSIAANPNPTSVDAGSLLGKVFITGAVTGYAQFENNVVPGDRKHFADLDNGQVFIQTTSGPIQFFLEAGTYALPDLGAPYVRADTANGLLFGPLPQFYVKFAPTDSFSIQVGKLPTLVGAEYTFSFENINIERGLLWNQEPAVSRGIQANYATGPISLSVSWTDGYYSNRYDWLTALATYTINSSNSVTVVGGGNTTHSTVSTFATPILQNNGQIYNFIYTHTSGPWTINPYYQYSSVPKSSRIGSAHKAHTSGVALLANYTFDAKSSLAGVCLPFRIEYITSSGSVADGSPNLLYGAGSRAWSYTLTPTYQDKLFYARAELGIVQASRVAPGAGFGTNGNGKTQSRFAVEAGIVF